jgi:hypothetical protein
MDSQKSAIVVFTARSPERIVREGGSQAWVLNHIRASQCTWLVCTQNRHHADHGFSDATQPHGAGFLVGKISALRKSQEEGAGDRWLIAISAFARIDLPDLWDHGRNPVRYMSLQGLGIDPGALEFQPMPEDDEDHGGADQKQASWGPSLGSPGSMLSIAEAKKGLAMTFGVKPEAVEITIRG